MPEHPFYFVALRLIYDLACLIIWLGRPLDYGYILKPFGFSAIGPPFGQAGNFSRFLAQFIVYFYLLVIC